MKKYAALGAIACFILFVIGANLMTAHLGMINLPFGLTVTAGTFAAGLVLIARDAINDLAGRLFVIGCIVTGALLSGVTAPAMIAAASAAAFLISELVDWSVYEPMRRRGWGRAVLLSSLIAAPVDTVIFLWIAPFPVTLSAVAGQVLVKTVLTLIVVAVGRGISAVLRDRIRTVSA